MKAIISEQGNGFPSVGDYCAGGGYLYRVVELIGQIQTGGSCSGVSNWINAKVELVEWEECEEEDEFPALVTVEDYDDEDEDEDDDEIDQETLERLADRAAEDGEHDIVSECQSLLYRKDSLSTREIKTASRRVRNYMKSLYR